MRVLFTSGPVYKHCAPMVAPVSEAVRRLGLITEELAKPVTGATFGQLFAGEVALESAEDLLAVAAEFKPDLVVRENAELGGYLFAEKIGELCVTLDTAAMAPTRHPDVLPQFELLAHSVRPAASRWFIVLLSLACLTTC